jgi:hypothetical protein
MIHSILLLAGSLLLLGPGPDSVKLAKTGKVLEGRVVFEGKEEIVLRANGKDQRIPRDDVAEIHSIERSLSTVLDRDLKSADAGSLADIAKACEQAGLAREARNFWLRVLLIDPKYEAAVKGLSAQVVKDEIRVLFGVEKRKLGDLAKRQASWKESYEIPSTHFVLRTDLELPLALDVSLALERNYRRFTETLAQPLEMFVFDEDPEVYIYGRTEDFPIAPVKGDPIWFAPGINRLNVLAAQDPVVRDVVHELIRMLLFNSLRRSAGATAQVPQWTASGVCDLFAIAAPAERFGKWSEIGVPDPGAFALAKRANIEFDRVFNASLNDFNGGPRRGEMSAAAYTLVHYFVFGKDGALRAGYGKFLREGAKGKISIGALTDALGLSRKEIESGWRAYIEANAR